MGFIKPMGKIIRTRKNKIQGKKTDFVIPTLREEICGYG